MTRDHSDEELLSRMAERNLDALETLCARYGGLAFALALRVTGHRQTAEEVVQDGFLAAWRGAPTFQSTRGSGRAWLLGIVRHRAIDVVRQRRARVTTVPFDDLTPVMNTDSVWPAVEQTLDREAIRHDLAALPADQRLSIELAYFGGLTYPEIAQQLQVPVGTIKSRLRLGLEKLRQLQAVSPSLGVTFSMTTAGAVPGPRTSGALIQGGRLQVSDVVLLR